MLYFATPPLSRPSGTRRSFIERIYDRLGLNKKFHTYVPLQSVTQDPDIMTSLVDARIRSITHVDDSGQLLGKDGRMISLTDHFGERAHEFAGYTAINAYLSPRDTHWWAYPYDGRITQTRIVEGRATIPTLMALEAIGIEVLGSAIRHNASIGSIYETARGQLGIIPIGSVNVNGMTIETDETLLCRRGDPYGYFRLGSTMVILCPPEWSCMYRIGDPIRIGEPLLRYS